MKLPAVTLVTGGCRSGKSTHALRLADAFGRRAFIATAEAHDDEMAARIARHQAERDRRFVTVEAPLDPAAALRRIPDDTQVIVLDCVTVWISNLLHHYEDKAQDAPEIGRLLEALRTPPCPVIVVTNEVGAGIVPMNPLARRFRDLAGTVNQQIAAIADTVLMTVCGIPITIKSDHPPA